MIFIDNRQTTIEFNKDYESIMEDIIDYTLKNEGVEFDYEISIILINNEEIQNLNREFRNIDKETDVLSFPMLEYENNKIYKDMYIGFSFTEEYMDEGRLVLGDIALSLEKAKAQSIEYGHSFIREVCYLVVHSILHLLGYDHMNEEEKAVMRKREEDILSAFNLMREL